MSENCNSSCGSCSQTCDSRKEENKEYKIFGESNIEEVAKKHKLDVVAKLPIEPNITSSVDKGLVELCDDSLFNNVINIIEKNEWRNKQ